MRKEGLQSTSSLADGVAVSVSYFSKSERQYFLLKAVPLFKLFSLTGMQSKFALLLCRISKLVEIISMSVSQLSNSQTDSDFSVLDTRGGGALYQRIPHVKDFLAQDVLAANSDLLLWWCQGDGVIGVLNKQQVSTLR